MSPEDFNALSLDEKLSLIYSKLHSADMAISKIVDEVKPTIDALVKSPLMKMFGGKK
jgi:hypothetical protein